ncbi:sugar phosphate isomerase/epimerase [Cohnella endophytica]|uniref:Sugar phosphate isomerase/epimerase n=1 Tax=Cohnella endophytica TaxID=2419778 RepID=A0A494Y1N0_9BACL|nr:sugar phosphate isomerase/epimerase family protein [Cohnella endophytica]RKP54347.1 sugar phosphate isomerase/epimerase [Cohnella endophytica]
MIRGLTRAGIGGVSDEQLIKLAARYGFSAVDIDALALINNRGLPAARELLEQNGVTIGSIELPVEWRESDTKFRQSMKDLAVTAEAAAALGCRNCCTYILPSTDEEPAAYMAQTIKRMRVIAAVLEVYEIRLGLEFVGPHHLRTNWKYPFIWTVKDTLLMIGAIGRPNVGLLVDTYHCHTTGFTSQDLLTLNKEQIIHVHINDAYDLPIEQLTDYDRLYPGEGVIDLAGMMGSLQKIGYLGAVSQEVLRAVSPSESIDDLLMRSKSGFDKVFLSDSQGAQI